MSSGEVGGDVGGERVGVVDAGAGVGVRRFGLVGAAGGAPVGAPAADSGQGAGRPPGVPLDGGLGALCAAGDGAQPGPVEGGELFDELGVGLPAAGMVCARG